MKFTTKHFFSSLAAIAASAALVPSASAAVIFNDTFEGYTLGNANGQGLWVDFGGALPTNIVNTISNGGSQSIAFSTSPPPGTGYGSDSTIDLAAPITSGQLVLSFDFYYPATNDGKSRIFISRGATNAPDFTFQQGLDLVGDGTAHTFGDTESPKTVLLTDQWVQVKLNIDLDADTLVASYGPTEIYNGAWVTDAGLPSQYRGIDIWAEGGTRAGTFYIDNMRLESVIPEPSSVALLGLGLGGLLLRRRRS